jgi:S1-C subfamily serine protease
VIAKVVPGGPGDDAGLATGDVITAVDNQPVASASDVQRLVRAHKPSDVISMNIMRNGEAATVKITVGEYPTER